MVIIGQLGSGLLGSGESLADALEDAANSGFCGLAPRRYRPENNYDGAIVWTNDPTEFKEIDCDHD